MLGQYWNLYIIIITICLTPTLDTQSYFWSDVLASHAYAMFVWGIPFRIHANGMYNYAGRAWLSYITGFAKMPSMMSMFSLINFSQHSSRLLVCIQMVSMAYTGNLVFSNHPALRQSPHYFDLCVRTSMLVKLLRVATRMRSLHRWQQLRHWSSQAISPIHGLWLIELLQLHQHLDCIVPACWLVLRVSWSSYSYSNNFQPCCGGLLSSMQFMPKHHLCLIKYENHDGCIDSGVLNAVSQLLGTKPRLQCLEMVWLVSFSTLLQWWMPACRLGWS